jgi:DNA gyrase subunit B
VAGEYQFLYSDEELAKLTEKDEKLEYSEFYEADDVAEAIQKLEKLGIDIEDYDPPKPKETKESIAAKAKGKENFGKVMRFKLERKDETPTYAESLAEVLKIVQEEGKKGLAIQRYKGLGEMNPEQLWETTMDPDRRTVLKVALEDAVQANETFTTLMGDEVEPRREFIHKYAREVRNLDI